MTEREIKEMVAVVDMTLKAVLTKEFSRFMAEFLWTYYNDLRKVGFSEEQAMNLCKFPDGVIRK